MAGDASRERNEAPGEVVTELRAIEWELSDVIRRLEELRDQVRHLQEEQTPVTPQRDVEGAP